MELCILLIVTASVQSYMNVFPDNRIDECGSYRILNAKGCTTHSHQLFSWKTTRFQILGMKSVLEILSICIIDILLNYDFDVDTDHLTQE